MHIKLVFLFSNFVSLEHILAETTKILLRYNPRIWIIVNSQSPLQRRESLNCYAWFKYLVAQIHNKFYCSVLKIIFDSKL